MEAPRLYVTALVLWLGFGAVATAQPATVESSAGTLRVETIAQGLDHPWGLAFLPDGHLLVTERPGHLRRISPDGRVSEPLAGVPEVFARGQGGLLDVAIDPDFGSNQRIYLSFAEPREEGAATAVARGVLEGNRLQSVQVIFRQEPAVSGEAHFGSRLAFAPDGNLFVTLGDRYKFEPAQDVSNHLGTIVRITPDGRVPNDNPLAGRAEARPEIWSYGHRNIQAAAIHPQTGALWEIEHGPKGGDELNIAEAGENYGWPLVSWGRHYNGRDIPDPDTRPEFAPSLVQWTPVIAPSGMTFYTGKRFRGWQDNLLVGGLVAQAVVRLEQDGRSAREVERISLGMRIRDVAQGPDEAIWVLTDEDNGKLLRLSPARSGDH